MKKKYKRQQQNPIEIQLLIARWKVLTGQPQYKLAEEIGIRPDQLSQIAHGIRPGYEYIPRIIEITEKLAS